MSRLSFAYRLTVIVILALMAPQSPGRMALPHPSRATPVAPPPAPPRVARKEIAKMVPPSKTPLAGIASAASPCERVSSDSGWRHLEPQGCIEVTVAAQDPLNRSSVEVFPGETYELVAWGVWVDLTIASGPDGYPDSKLIARCRANPSPGCPTDAAQLDALKRSPENRLFTLMGTLDPASDDPSLSFKIGSGTTRTFDRRGDLFLYANDAPDAYGNNKRFVTLRMTRKR